MFDLCLHGAREIVEKLKYFMTSPIGIFLYTVVAGVVGIVILLAFFSMVVSASSLSIILPCIIAFNAAAGGYSLVEKREEHFPIGKLAIISLAALFTVTGCSVITLFCPWEPLLDGGRYLISGLSALIFTYFGTWIACKSKNLNKSS